MDEVTASNNGQSQPSRLAVEGSSSSSASVAERWRPSPMAFRPYAPLSNTGEKPQTLRVVVRRPVSILLFRPVFRIFTSCRAEVCLLREIGKPHFGYFVLSLFVWLFFMLITLRAINFLLIFYVVLVL